MEILPPGSFKTGVFGGQVAAFLERQPYLQKTFRVYPDQVGFCCPTKATSMFFPQWGQFKMIVIGCFMMRSATAVSTESILSNLSSIICTRCFNRSISIFSKPVAPGLLSFAKTAPLLWRIGGRDFDGKPGRQ
jgi:hypothetical protein